MHHGYQCNGTLPAVKMGCSEQVMLIPQLYSDFVAIESVLFYKAPWKPDRYTETC